MEERLSAEPRDAAAPPELLLDVRNGVARVTLNRPAALNALTFGMLEGLTERLDAWERDDRVRVIVLRGAGDKAFCAGGDIRALYAGHRAGRTDLLDYFVVEYALDHRFHTYPKPVVAVMDGIVMGGGMGLAQGARLRVATDRTRMAMPETSIGLFPDVGASWFLTHAPGRLGDYIGLVGQTLRAADAVYANLADAYFPPESLARLDAELESLAASADPAGELSAMARRLAAKPSPPGELEALRDAIDVHFAKPDMAAICASLRSIADPALAEWRDRTLAILGKRSPTALAVAREQLTRGRGLGLGDVFRMELGMVRAALEHGDFIEGIRALIIDKDNAPRWRPLERAAVERFFDSRWPDNRHPLAHLA